MYVRENHFISVTEMTLHPMVIHIQIHTYTQTHTHTSPKHPRALRGAGNQADITKPQTHTHNTTQHNTNL
jgi:hypothetical protein